MAVNSSPAGDIWGGLKSNELPNKRAGVRSETARDGRLDPTGSAL